MFKNKTILVTGGTGSIGKAFVKHLISNHNNFKKLIIFSRDELKQFDMSQQKEFQNPKLRMFLGDIRDRERLNSAFENVDIVIHAAALKQVPAAEYNPFEYIKTNVLGTQNIIGAALDNKVKDVISLSTDKASSPINLYGATKLCSDKLILTASNFKGSKKTNFTVVRYGNVTGSRGSVIPLFKKINRMKKKLPLTHEKMTRFNISLNSAIDLVKTALKNKTKNAIFVPKLKSFYIKDLAEAISGKKNNFNIVGIRPGEKIHEELINPAEARYTVELKNFYIILNDMSETEIIKFCKLNKCKRVKTSFSYNSGDNKSFIDIKSLKKIAEKNQTH